MTLCFKTSIIRKCIKLITTCSLLYNFAKCRCISLSLEIIIHQGGLHKNLYYILSTMKWIRHLLIALLKSNALTKSYATVKNVAIFYNTKMPNHTILWPIIVQRCNLLLNASTWNLWELRFYLQHKTKQKNGLSWPVTNKNQSKKTII